MNFEEVTRLPAEVKKDGLKATTKEIKNPTFIMEGTRKEEIFNPCVDMYKTKIQYDGSLNKIQLRIEVRGELKNKEMIGDNWSPTASMRTLKYFLADDSKQKVRRRKLYFIG